MNDVNKFENNRLTYMSPRYKQALIRTTKEEGVGALYKGLAPNVLRGMSMNVGMLACYDQAKETVATLLNDPMTNGPSLPTKMGASCIAVSSACSCSSTFVCISTGHLTLYAFATTPTGIHRGTLFSAI